MDIITGTVVQSLSVIQPFSIVFNPTGTRAFVSSGSGSVKVIDTSTYQAIKTVPADFGATDLQITPDGAFVYVNNSAAQSVTVIDTQSLTATTSNIGGAPKARCWCQRNRELPAISTRLPQAANRFPTATAAVPF